MTPTIRQATWHDLDAAARMRAIAWQESYQGLLGPNLFEGADEDVRETSAHWADLMQAGHYFWVVVDDGRIVGVSHAGPARDEDAPATLELTTLYLLEQAKGTGVGEALLHTTIGDAPAYLWVLQGYERAVSFYQGQGFELDGAVRDVVGMRGAREVRMVRHLRRADCEA